METAGKRRAELADYVVALRPWQWIKNLVVLLPVVFARRFFDPAVMREGILAVLAFCLLASGVYLFNDVCDRATDATDPIRSRRPIAAGRIAATPALALASSLAAAGVLLIAWACDSRRAAFLAVSYVALNVAYSLALKRAALVGALCVAGGFVIRVHAGGAVTGIEISHWLTICIFLGAFTVALGKRSSDAVTTGVQSSAGAARLGLATRIAGALFVASYVAYGLAPRTLEVFGTRALVLSAPFVLLGVFAFERQARRGLAADPARLFVRDPLLLGAVVLYGASIAAIFAAAVR